MDPSTSVIIPAYNEEGSLREVTERVLKMLSEYNLSGEIIIVDDGSTDRTGVLADELAQANPILKAVHHNRPLGKTAAISVGIRKARGAIFAIIDADLQYSPEDLPKLLEPILANEYDLVNGWRVTRSDPRTRILASRIYNWLVRRFFHTDIQDNNSGLKTIKREVMKTVMPQLRRDFHRYLIPLAHHYGYRLAEVPICHNPRKGGHPKYSSLIRLITGPVDMITLKLVLTFEDNPATLFGIPGAIMAVAGTTVGIYLVLLRFIFDEPLSRHLSLSALAVVLIMSGTLFFMMGFLANMVAAIRAEIREIVRSR